MAAYKAADRSGDGFVSRNEFGYFPRLVVLLQQPYGLSSARSTTILTVASPSRNHVQGRAQDWIWARDASVGVR
jgi:hypothetical protein